MAISYTNYRPLMPLSLGGQQLLITSVTGSHLRAGRDRKEGENMAREKPNYRETLIYLQENGFTFLMNKKDVAAKLSISRPTLDRIIKSGKLKVSDGKIPIGALASYLCGG